MVRGKKKGWQPDSVKRELKEYGFEVSGTRFLFLEGRRRSAYIVVVVVWRVESMGKGTCVPIRELRRVWLMVRLFLIGVTLKTFLVATVRDSENTETSRMDWRTSCSNMWS